ncbi:MAG: protein disulfide oxidoreductase [Bacteroidota bacterium]
MTFLDVRTRAEIQKRFQKLVKPVKIVHFTQEINCQYCRETRQLLTELSELSDKITLEIYNFVTDKGEVEAYKVDKVPATAVVGEKDYGIRYYGIPSGYEFASLLEDIEMVSTGEHGLSEETLAKLQNVTEPVHIQVFVTPTCPYCPSAVLMAHALAFVNENIRGDMIEAQEFMELSYRYNVRGVPRVVINEDHHFEGALPEPYYVEQVLAAVGADVKDQ